MPSIRWWSCALRRIFLLNVLQCRTSSRRLTNIGEVLWFEVCAVVDAKAERMAGDERATENDKKKAWKSMWTSFSCVKPRLSVLSLSPESIGIRPACELEVTSSKTWRNRSELQCFLLARHGPLEAGWFALSGSSREGLGEWKMVFFYRTRTLDSRLILLRCFEVLWRIHWRDSKFEIQTFKQKTIS